MEFNKGDKGQSVLKNFEKVFKNDVHDTWSSPNGLLYKFKLTFDNGLVGVANSKSEDGKAYTTGETYEYEVRVKNEYGIILKAGKPRDDSSGHGTSNKGYSKRDPNQEYYIMMSVAVETSAITVKDLSIHLQRPTDLKACVGLFSKWMLRKIYVEKCNSINIQAALRRAIILIGVQDQNVDSPETVLIKADEFYKSINNNVEWMKNSVQKMLSQESEQNTQNQLASQSQPSQEEKNPGNNMKEVSDEMA